MGLLKRKLDHGKTYLSPLCLGTMRFAEKGLSINDITNLFQTALRLGITTHHISNEYESFDLVCSAYRKMTSSEKSKIQLIVKLAAPHFKEESFSPSIFRHRVDQYLKDTGFQKICVLQWMWRQESNDEQCRIDRLESQVHLLKESFRRVELVGKVDTTGCFPYSKVFMDAIKALGVTQTEINYFNLFENQLIFSDKHPCAIAIRPLAAGKLNQVSPENINAFNTAINARDDQSLIETAIQYPLLLSSTTSVVISMNTIGQLEHAASAVSELEPDSLRYEQISKSSCLLEGNCCH